MTDLSPSQARSMRAFLDSLVRSARRFGGWRPDGSGGDRVVPGQHAVEQLELSARRLLSERAHAAGTALPASFIQGYSSLPDAQREEMLTVLAEAFGPDEAALRRACEAYLDNPGPEAANRLASLSEAPRQELFRRINQAPLGTAALVRLREDVLDVLPRRPDLKQLDDDLLHLFRSWFNRGFLVMRRIDWSSPADLLEKIIRYEAVHSIESWRDLRERLAPADRRCYAFFHPALLDEPLIFIEVALTPAIVPSIQTILAPDRDVIPPGAARAAMFYSISNCQRGLQGVSFGHHLIQQVVEDLLRELPNLSQFVTLSPVPGFGAWVREQAAAGREEAVEALAEATGGQVPADSRVLPLAVDYFTHAKDRKGRPRDPVARFHLGNGARLERLCPAGDVSAHGLGASLGLMVNYLYDLSTLEANRDSFIADGTVTWGAPAKASARQASQMELTRV